MSEKIQKVLANAGLASRRQIEVWLKEGRISINGQVAKLGDRITCDVKARVDGREIKLIKSAHKKTRVLLYHKPQGEICSRTDPEKRPTVFDHLPMLRNGRWISVGRLDFNTSGVLLLTNDGELANRLMHPSREIEREYAVRIQGQVSPEMLKKLKEGIIVDEKGPAHFERIIDTGGEGSNHWYTVLVKEGRNRIVRKLWESQGVTVSRLIRIRFGDITLPRSLRRGKWMELERDAVNILLETVK
jgi:23S rRNA pseudouridine2605 synthase